MCRLRRAHQAPTTRSSPAAGPASPLRPPPAETSPADGVLRLVSGGQDCEVALWDFSTVSEDSMVLRWVQVRVRVTVSLMVRVRVIRVEITLRVRVMFRVRGRLPALTAKTVPLQLIQPHSPHRSGSCALKTCTPESEEIPTGGGNAVTW